ncbi:MAG: pyridoxamine kinase [Oscillospiraceae bacterium]|jgi:pyridoxine kinase|nr:pyridoxamine kinase [Oscillospiraceae bacterium]
MERQKRVAAIHDISGFGKCSLTVALPIISAAGVECTCMPTAVLSTHTGGFTGFTYRDLTEDMRPITDHWQSLELKFDAIYSGFLGSFDQIEIVKEFYDKFKTEDNIILADPAMADNGKMYTIFDMAFAAEMASLCAKADIVVPNFTEAVFMLGEEFVEGPYSQEYVEGLMKRLAGLGPRQVVLTGVYFDDKKLGAATYDKTTGEVSYAFAEKIEGYYHGTGDVYASALLSALLNKKTLAEAAAVAVNFTRESIMRTKNAGTDIRFGVDFERGLPQLMKDLDLA